MEPPTKPSRARLTITVLASSLIAVAAVAHQGTQDGEWRYYGGDMGSTGYSPLDQIDKDNFNQLELAWTWESIDGFLSKTGPNGEWWADASTVFDALEEESPDRWRGGLNPRLSSLKATP